MIFLFQRWDMLVPRRVSIHMNSSNLNLSFKLIQPWQIHSSKGQTRGWPLNHHLGCRTCSSHRPSTWETWLWWFCCYQIKWLEMRTNKANIKKPTAFHTPNHCFFDITCYSILGKNGLYIWWHTLCRKVRFLHTPLERDAKLLIVGEMWLDLPEQREVVVLHPFNNWRNIWKRAAKWLVKSLSHLSTSSLASEQPMVL